MAAGCMCFSPAHAAVVSYYPGSGLLQLDNNGADYSATLGSFQIYLASTANLPSTLDPVWDWTSQIVSTTTGGLAGGNSIDWDNNSSVSNDVLPAGVYNLAQLAPGLSASAFGYYYHSNVPPPKGSTYSFGPADSAGAVEFGGIQGGAAVPDIVYTQRVVPSQNTWSGPAGGGSWNTANNWSLSHSASSGETASFTNTSLAGTVTLDHNQAAGSLWFNSSNPYTIAAGSGGYTLTLSNTASIWIDAGLHTISAPWS